VTLRKLYIIQWKRRADTGWSDFMWENFDGDDVTAVFDSERSAQAHAGDYYEDDTGDVQWRVVGFLEMPNDAT
jgi:hypothetical protein